MRHAHVIAGGLGVGLWLLAGEALGAPCSGALPQPFEEREGGGFRLLIARFQGTDAGSEAFGGQLGPALREELDKYMRQELRSEEARKAELRAGDVQTRYQDCTLADHDAARQYGQEVGADVVLFGQAMAEDRKALARQAARAPHVKQEINGSATVSGKGAALQRIDLKVAGPKGSFKTYVTVVQAPKLETSGGKSLAQTDLLQLAFPEMATAEPLALFRLALGLVAYRQQRHGLAARYFEEAKGEVYEGAEVLPGIYQVIGINYLMAGPGNVGLPEGESIKRGMAALEQARASCPSKDLGCQAVGLHNLAWGHARLGDNKRALEFYDKALPIRRQVGDHSGEAATLNNIGGVYDALGDKKRALEFYDKALPLFQQIGDRRGEATTLNNIGLVYDALGDKKRALEFFDKALPLLQQVGDRRGEATTLNNIGLVYDALGDKKRAL